MVPEAPLSRTGEPSVSPKKVSPHPFCELTHRYDVRQGKITPVFAALMFIFDVVNVRTVVGSVEFAAALKTYSDVAFRS